MIRFPCRCGHEFSVLDEDAGYSVQCPKCGLLVDVPALSDLANIEADGTFVLGDDPVVRDEPGRLAELERVFTSRRVDDEGNEIDLRTDPTDLELKPLEPEPTKPRYDPETGELIRAVDLKPDPELDAHVNPASIPMAKAAIEYATGDRVRRVGVASAALALFSPVNVIVMAIVVVAHLLFHFGGYVVIRGMVFAFVFPLALGIMIVGHFGCIVDEIGPRDKDELPRPLRDASWGDDIWGPFVHLFGSFMIAYALPLSLVGLVGFLPDAVRGVMVWGVVAVGTFFFPAIFLTLSTSGTVMNLRPDRVWGVIHACGPSYVMAVLAYAGAAFVYGLGVVGSFMASVASLSGSLIVGPSIPWYGRWSVGMPLLLAGVYLVHLYCWYMGLLYRAHHGSFPWVLQRHVADPNRKKKPPMLIAGAVVTAGPPAAAKPAAAPKPVRPVVAARPSPVPPPLAPQARPARPGASPARPRPVIPLAPPPPQGKPRNQRVPVTEMRWPTGPEGRFLAADRRLSGSCAP